MATPKAIVKRNGELKEIPSEHVVPGDIVMLDAGRYIPCDLRLIETANLKVEESALTGESVPVDKDAIYHPSMQRDEQSTTRRSKTWLYVYSCNIRKRRRCCC